MGQVALKVRIIPKEAEKFEEMKAELFSKIKAYKSDDEDIGFGLKALSAVFIIPDAPGQQDKVEAIFASCELIGSVETISASLVS